MRQIENIKNVLIAGSGVMGASLAQIFAGKGFNVILYGRREVSLEKAAELIRVNQASNVQAGAMTEAETQELIGRIRMTTDKACFREADFVLEAIAEDMEAKHIFWKEVSEAAGEDVVLATNTSGLSITEIAKAVSGPERFAGMHWVNPPHLIKLVEVIAGEKSADEALGIIRDLAVALGQKPVTVRKDPPGFILNRLQYAVIREACNCVQEGYASVEDVDNVMKYGLGMRYAAIGPFETMDFGGVDLFNQVGSYLFAELSNETGVPEIMKQVYEDGGYGLKNGKGFYDYSGDKAEKAFRRRDTLFIRLAECLFGEEV